MKTRTFLIVMIVVAALVAAAAYLHSAGGQVAHSVVSPIHGGR
jgi:hypothetical protein